MLEHWMWLASLSGISDRKKRNLIECFGSPENVWLASDRALSEQEGVTPQIIDALKERDLSKVQKSLETCDTTGIDVITIEDKNYPQRLKEIYDAPLVLYLKGRLPDFDNLPAVGIVGTRKASAYGLSMARRFGEEITMCGGLVVSGMAGGVDAAAMAGAFQAGGSAVAVLGSGVDVVYPKSGKGLYQDTCMFGCVISQYLPGTPPLRWNFPQRNRIISGLSCGVVIVEAPEGSGSLITAQHALDQGRDVYVVPGNIDMESFLGSNRLIREGAGIVLTGWDVLSEYAYRFPNVVHRQGVPIDRIAVKRANNTEKNSSDIPDRHITRRNQTKKSVDNKITENYIDTQGRFCGLTADEKLVADTLTHGPRLADDIIAEVELPSGKVIGLLTLLEIKGVIRRLPGKRISLT